MRDNKVLFKMRCVNNGGFVSLYTEGKVYPVIENKGVLMDDGRYSFESYSNFEELVKSSMPKWELVEEQTLLDMIYEKLGIEDMEEFKIGQWDNFYRFNKGILEVKASNTNKYCFVGIPLLQRLIEENQPIIKLPPKPQFTEEEKEQIKAIHLLFGECWVARDRNKDISIFKEKPTRDTNFWRINTYITDIESEFLPFIKWEDIEPFKVDKQLIESLKE